MKQMASTWFIFYWLYEEFRLFSGSDLNIFIVTETVNSPVNNLNIGECFIIVWIQYLFETYKVSSGHCMYWVIWGYKLSTHTKDTQLEERRANVTTVLPIIAGEKLNLSENNHGYMVHCLGKATLRISHMYKTAWVYVILKVMYIWVNFPCISPSNFKFG